MTNFGLRKLEISFYGEVQSILRYLGPFRHDTRVVDGQTDGQTFC